MRLAPSFALALVALTLAAPDAVAAVDVVQKDNAFDRFFERLPDMRLVRGARPKQTKLVITSDEAWTVNVSEPWMTVTPASGSGNAEVTLAFDAGALNALEDPTGTITVTGASADAAVLNVNWNIWPNLVDAEGREALIAYAKNPANWPSDSGFGGAYELWGFLPDETTHPGTGAGANIDEHEKTPCAPGTVGDDCVREGQAGLAGGQSADQAWLLSTGDPRIIIGELDSGIRWSERSLINKFYLNANELAASCPPPGAVLGEGDVFEALDVNKDGMFTIRDYDEAPWIVDVNQNGARDPQDLIWGDDGDGPCSDGVDDDGNGYVDDISGWDFFWNDNDASDDTDFGHGTGEANDSTAEAHDGEGTPGVCPRCLVMPVRVGDSFICDANQFADGVIFTVESGAQVVQEALGTINNTPYAQAAIDWAYENGVPVIASAADETSYHHNMPGALNHTIYVHAITFDDDGDNNELTASTFLNFNNCTNFGGHLSLSTPGSGCSSEATGKTAGQTGLLMSYFLQLQDDGDAYYEAPLSAEEVYQVLVASADDIDVPGAEKDPEALLLQKFPSNEGWDLHFGYGRNNARRSLELLRDKRIPPEADIRLPLWFDVFDPTRTPSFEVTGSVGSPRNDNVRWELHVAEGVVGKTFTKIAEGNGAVDDAVLGSVDLTRAGPLAALVARSADPAGSDPEQFTATLELRSFATNPDGDEVRGIFRKTFGVRTDESTHQGFPIYLAASGESSPKLSDIDGDGREEIVLATADGLVHAIGADAQELPGFPAELAGYSALAPEVCSADPRKCHRAARPFATGVIDPDDVRQSLIATVAIGDMDGDAGLCADIVIATIDGLVFRFDCNGALHEGFPVEIERDFLTDGLEGARRCLAGDGVTEIIGCRSDQRFSESGFASSPVLVDLDRDGSLEIVAGGLDSQAYAWHADGSVVNGWPVHLDHPNIPAFNDEGEINRFVDRIIGTPTVAYVFGRDEDPVIFLGTTERRDRTNEAYLYGIKSDGTFPAGWPAIVNGFIPDEILPYMGRGMPNSVAAADMDGDGDDEVIAAGMGGFMTAFDAEGRIFSPGGVDMIMLQTVTDYGKNATTDETFSLPVINNPSIADLDGDGKLDFINGTAGSGLVAVASEGGRRNVFDHSVSAWDSASGFFHDGFPQRVWDFQFFMNYVVADLEGTGRYNVISGDGGYFVYAPNVDGRSPAGFPKWTQGWHIPTPAVGDLDGDENIDVVANTREGWLWAWKTNGHVGGPADAKYPAIQWASFHHDDQNTGNYGTPLKQYPRLAPPDDGGCTCSQLHDVNERTPAVAGLVAAALLAGTLSVTRRRRRHPEGGRA